MLLVGLRGLEPPTLRLSGVRSNHLSYEPLFPLTQQLSVRFLVSGPLPFRAGGDDGARTREPPACKAGALPTELPPRIPSIPLFGP